MNSTRVPHGRANADTWAPTTEVSASASEGGQREQWGGMTWDNLLNLLVFNCFLGERITRCQMFAEYEFLLCFGFGIDGGKQSRMEDERGFLLL
jgi:hypothetical protein